MNELAKARADLNAALKGLNINNPEHLKEYATLKAKVDQIVRDERAKEKLNLNEECEECDNGTKWACKVCLENGDK